MTEEHDKPNGIYGHWAKKMIEDGAEVEDDIDEIEEENSIEYDFDEYVDDE